MSKKKHVPENATKRDHNKTVRQQPQPNYQQESPAWRFSTIDKNGPFSWPQNEGIELEIVQKLHSFDSMTWQQIEGSDHHSIPLHKLSKEAQTRLTEIKKDDLDTVFSFHLAGKPRIICIRIGHIAQLLWYDPEHKVCPSTLKHT